MHVFFFFSSNHTQRRRHASFGLNALHNKLPISFRSNLPGETTQTPHLPKQSIAPRWRSRLEEPPAMRLQRQQATQYYDGICVCKEVSEHRSQQFGSR